MSPEISLWETFFLFGQPHRSLYVNNNGVLSLGAPLAAFPAPGPPLAGSAPWLAPYWSDVDTRLGGAVFFRQSRAPRLLARLRRDLGAAMVTPVTPAVTPVTPNVTWALVATWERVRFFGAASDKVNTFQAVLASDGAASFVIFNYAELQWGSSISSHGDAHSGMGGTEALAGFGSGSASFALPGSRSPAVLDLARSSNSGARGRWLFRVDTPPGHAPSSPAPSSPAPSGHAPTEPNWSRGATEERSYVCG